MLASISAVRVVFSAVSIPASSFPSVLRSRDVSHLILLKVGLVRQVQQTSTIDDTWSLWLDQVTPILQQILQMLLHLFELVGWDLPVAMIDWKVILCVDSVIHGGHTANFLPLW